MFPTKVMVAPNSPKLRLNANTNPVNTPGNDKGNVIVKNTFIGLAPKDAAASSNLWSTCEIPNLAERTRRGKAITAEAKTAPIQVNAILTPKCVYKKFPINPCLPNASRSKNPGTTGGKTSGKCTKLSINDFPKNDFLASTHAIKIAGIQIIIVQHKATFNERSSAEISEGVKHKKSNIIYRVTGLKPNFRKILLALSDLR